MSGVSIRPFDLDPRFHVYRFSSAAPQALVSGRRRSWPPGGSVVITFRPLGAEGRASLLRHTGLRGSRIRLIHGGRFYSVNDFASERCRALPAASKSSDLHSIHGSDTSHGRGICFARRIKLSAFVHARRA